MGVLKELLIAAAGAANSGGPIPTFQQKIPGLLQRLESINLDITKSTRTFTV